MLIVTHIFWDVFTNHGSKPSCIEEARHDLCFGVPLYRGLQKLVGNDKAMMGVDGTDCSEVWILIADDAILLMILPFKEILCFFFPFREAHFFPLYNLFFNLVVQPVG